MDEYLAGLTTETVNINTTSIDECSTLEMVKLISKEDELVIKAVNAELNNIADAVDTIYESLKDGGRLFYVGCGTSGRLGVLDASECPPTYGTSPEMIQGYIAGGDTALRNAVEGSEDDKDAGYRLADEAKMRAGDVLVGITASGSAPYVIGTAMRAKELGMKTIALVNNRDSRLGKICDIEIAPIVGAEVIMGSTRMKSGTAQKLVLNMLSTCTMIKLGKVYNNLMVDLKASNSKLADRSVRITAAAAEVSPEIARDYLDRAGGNVKAAVLMIKTGVELSTAIAELDKTCGHLKKAIKNASRTV